ncbi:MAG: hypothetical protein ACOYIF_03495 [Acetivibrionales bacterium]|jgi:hypothetical protein
MDKRSGQECRVKSIFFYLKESIKFHDLDRPVVAQILFVLLLTVIFSGYIFARPYIEDAFLYYEQISISLMEQVETKNIDLSLLNSEIIYKMFDSLVVVLAIYVVIKAVSYIIATYYGVYYFYSLTNKETTWAQRTVMFMKKIFRIIIFNILFYGVFSFLILVISLTIVLISLFVPVLMMLITFLPIAVLAYDMLFIFKNLLIIKFDVGIFKNFKLSLSITKECKKRVILNGLWPHFLGLILSTFAMDVQNPILALFIVSFFEVIILLISQRLTGLMFIDAASIERKDKKNENNKG